MTGSGGNAKGGQVNWRRIIFYVIEGVYAFIAGTGEAYMYAAYNPPGTLRWWEAIGRAVITQFAIVFFGVAGIEAMQWKGSKWVRFFGVFGSWSATFIGCVITFWLLLDSARVFRDNGMLGPLNNATIPLPGGGSLPNEVIDITIIAAVPFFQLGLNILGGLITADHEPESLEDQQQRQEKELARQRYLAEKRRIQAGGLGAAARAAGTSLLARNESSSSSNSSPFAEDNNDDPGGPGGLHLPGQTATGTEGISTSITGPRRGKAPGIHALPGIPKGMIDKTGLVAWVADNLHRHIEPEEALRLIKTIPGHGPQKDVRGGPIVANKTQAIQRARGLWGTAPTQQVSEA